MEPAGGESTSITLLGRLRDQPVDESAWRDFVARYRTRIFAHCLSVGLQPADAEDVTQSVLFRLAVKLPAFRYDPTQSFRAWLRTMTRHALSDFLAEHRRMPGGGDSAILRLLDHVAAGEGLAREMEAEFDRELLDEALRRARLLVPPRQWEAFRLTALDGLSGAEAGARLGMLVATVYTAKSKVQKLVRDEVRRLEAEPQPS